eukprot:1879185-Alexandrium_andersonii.AAC.1
MTEADLRQFEQRPSSWINSGLSRKNAKGSEVSLRHLSEEDLAKFRSAKDLEVKQWIQEKAVSIAQEGVPSGRLMRMRWVLTWKPLEDGSGQSKAKARL